MMNQVVRLKLLSSSKIRNQYWDKRIAGKNNEWNKAMCGQTKGAFIILKKVDDLQWDGNEERK